ncbi:MAG: hypothetical protein ACO1NQ_02375 [Flavobacteriales bacterium]
MEPTLTRLMELAQRRSRFTYDLRGDCIVYTGVVAAYRATDETPHFLELPKAIAHAFEHDGLVGAWRDPETGRTSYDSCRLFMDLDSALRFAREQRQQAVYNLNREQEVYVDPEGERAETSKATDR